MQFFRYIFSKNTYSFANLSKEIIIALFIISIPTIYPKTANAGLFSFFTGVTGDEASASTLGDPAYTPNSQNMTILKTAVNYNPNPHLASNQPIVTSENSLLAEIGPSGIISDIEEPVNTQISIYVVHSGDTLSEIAEMFNVSVNTIVWANNLGKSPVIREGQTLVILPITGIRHIVQKGDTIKGIVAKYKTDLDEVLTYNNLSIDSVINEGDTIIIPDAELTTPAETKTTTPQIKNSPSYANYYMRPIVGGWKSQGIHGNNAVDLAAPIGTPIYAAASGTVIASMFNGGWNGGYGNYVIISHSNGTQTLYAHTSANLVTVRQSVKKGEMIAKIGVTGKTTGPHVHFEIRGAKNPF